MYEDCLQFAFQKVEHHHGVYVSRVAFSERQWGCCRIRDVLRNLAVLYGPSIHQLGKVVCNGVDEEWAELNGSEVMKATNDDNDRCERTYSIMNTVLQPSWGPRSFKVTSPPSTTPASLRVFSSASCLLPSFKAIF